MDPTVPLKPVGSRVDARAMWRTRLLAVLVVAALTAGCSPGGDRETVSSAQGGAATGTTTATFRWVHAYERSGRYALSVLARAGTCSEGTGTGGVTGVIEVT